MKLLFLLVSLFSVPTLAAVCSCDAPPSCGPRPGSCFQQVARDFVGKTFIEKGVANPNILTFSEKLSDPNIIDVGWGRHTDGMPFGTYFASFTSENTFSLFIMPFNGNTPSLVEEFEAFTLNGRAEIESLRARDGRLFVVERRFHLFGGTCCSRAASNATGCDPGC